VGVGGVGGEAHDGADGGVLVHRVGRRVGVRGGGDGELVHVVDGDGGGAHGGAAVRGDGRVLAAAGRRVDLAVDGPGDGDHARVGVDGEAAAGAVHSFPTRRSSDLVGVGGVGGEAHDGADGGVLVHRVGRRVGVRGGGDGELVHVVDG